MCSRACVEDVFACVVCVYGGKTDTEDGICGALCVCLSACFIISLTCCVCDTLLYFVYNFETTAVFGITQVGESCTIWTHIHHNVIYKRRVKLNTLEQAQISTHTHTHCTHLYTKGVSFPSSDMEAHRPHGINVLEPSFIMISPIWFLLIFCLEPTHWS